MTITSHTDTGAPTVLLSHPGGRRRHESWLRRLHEQSSLGSRLLAASRTATARLGAPSAFRILLPPLHLPTHAHCGKHTRHRCRDGPKVTSCRQMGLEPQSLSPFAAHKAQSSCRPTVPHCTPTAKSQDPLLRPTQWATALPQSPI